MTIQEKATQIVANAQVITLASIDEGGYPRPVPLSKLGVDGRSIFVSTGTHSLKTNQFRVNPKAGLSIIDDQSSIIFTGEVEIVVDMAIKRAYWSDWMLAHMPAGVEDPEYTLLKFTPKAATYWIDNEFVREEF